LRNNRANSKEKLKRSDIIKIGNNKYLIFSIEKDELEVLPIDHLLELDEPADVIPKMKISYSSLTDYEKVNKTEILYLINQKNPLIKRALKNFFKDEEK
jgi:hypothetical protein